MTIAVRLDVSLNNERLFNGCQIERIAGRLNLVTPPDAAVNIIGENIHRELANYDAEQKQQGIVLTGPAPIWVYLIVFHAVVHLFREVSYDDGRNGAVLIARHG